MRDRLLLWGMGDLALAVVLDGVLAGRSTLGCGSASAPAVIAVFSGAVATLQEDRACGIVLLPSGQTRACHQNRS